MTPELLQQLQCLPLELKIQKSKIRIREWYEHWDGDVYVSFSGGKDSLVLLDLVRSVYPEVPAVFSDIGLEYPEVKSFVKTFDNIEIIKPRHSFKDILTKYGYPIISKEVAGNIDGVRKFIYEKINNNTIRLPNELDVLTNYVKQNVVNEPETLPLLESEISFRVATLLGILDKQAILNWNIPKGNNSIYHKKRWQWLLNSDFKISDKCCYHMKKSPMDKYMHETNRKPYIGTLADESNARRSAWLKHGCNTYKSHPSSAPLSFWTEQDILQYIYENNLPLCSVYGEIQLVDGKYECTKCNRTGCMFCMFGIHYDKENKRFGQLKQTHPKLYDYCMRGGEYNELGWWQPSQDGLGMKHVLDFINMKGNAKKD